MPNRRRQFLLNGASIMSIIAVAATASGCASRDAPANLADQPRPATQAPPAPVRVYVPSPQPAHVLPKPPRTTDPQPLPSDLLPTLPPTPTPIPTPTPTRRDVTSEPSVYVEGDSLTVGSAQPLRAALDGAVSSLTVDAKEGRSTAEGVSRLLQRGKAANVWVVALGTNDSDPTQFSAQVDAVLAAAGQRRVIWVNIVKPQAAGKLNRALRKHASDAANLKLVDWAAVVKKHPEVLAGDGVHATWQGYRLRAQAIADTVTAN